MVRTNQLRSWLPAAVLASFATFAAPAAACPGDCDADGEVTVDEIIAGVGIALGELPPERCPAIDLDGDGHVTVDELLASVAALLQGCPSQRIIELHIDAPAHGMFTTAGRIELRGRAGPLPEGYELRLDGAAVGTDARGDFSASIEIAADVTFRPILAEVVDASGRLAARRRVVVIVGEALPSTEFAAAGLEARITDSGLAEMGAGLTAGLPLDLEAILAPGTVLVSRYCALDSVFGCLQRVDVTARSAAVREVAVALDSTPGALVADIAMDEVRVVVNVRGGAINCDVAATTSQALVTGQFDLAPATEAPERIAVRQLGDVDVRFSDFRSRISSGVCDFPLLGDLIRLLLGDLEPRLRRGLVEFLRDPDGEGPGRAPLAAAIEDGLAEFSMSAALGSEFGAGIESRFIDIIEDESGVTFRVGTRVVVTDRPVDAPALGASLHVEASPPDWPPSAAVEEGRYEFGVAIAPTAVNQLLRGAVETGLLGTYVTEFALGSDRITLSAGFLGLFIAEFAALAPETPLALRLRPTLAPVVTGKPAARPDQMELLVSDLILAIEVAADGRELLAVALDAALGFGLGGEDGALALRVEPPGPGDVGIVVVRDAIGVDVRRLEASLPIVVAQLFPLLAPALPGIQLPEILGMTPQLVEANVAGGYVVAQFRGH